LFWVAGKVGVVKTGGVRYGIAGSWFLFRDEVVIYERYFLVAALSGLAVAFALR
jgi:hypothetical protein